MSAQEAIQPRLLGLEKQYTPLYQKLQEEGISSGLESLARLQGQAQGVSAGLQKDLITSQAPIYAQLGQAATGAYEQTLDPRATGLYNSLMTSAQTDLAAGRNLTPEMQKLAEQTARQAMAARGLSGNQAVMQEVLNSYQLADARENRARQFAGSVYDASTARTNAALTAYGAPLMSQISGVSPSSLVQGGAGLYGSMGARLFEPESQYNASLITANRQEQMQADLANAQSRSGLMSGLMGMAGAVGGAYLGNPGLFAGKTSGALNLGAGMDGSIPNVSIPRTTLGASSGFGTYQGLGGQTLGGSYQGITSSWNPLI